MIPDSFRKIGFGVALPCRLRLFQNFGLIPGPAAERQHVSGSIEVYLLTPEPQTPEEYRPHASVS